MSNNKFQDARQCLVEAEALLLGSLASARAQIALLEEENRQLLQDKLKREKEIFTEKEFAKKLKVSQSTIARLRKDGKIEAMWVGDQPRYTSTDHLDKVEEIFRKKIFRKRQSRGSLRRVS